MKKEKKKVRVIISVSVLAIILIVLVVSLLYWKKINQQNQIDKLLMEMQTDYQALDLDAVENCIDKLDELGYEDAPNMKKILNYDKSVKDGIIEFYKEIADADVKLKNYSVTSMNMLLDNLKVAIQDFNELPENEDSELGKYIVAVKSNTMYQALKSQLETNIDNIDFDYGLVKNGYVMIFETYTDEILKIEFPYEKAIDDIKQK